jgi:HD-like signal output (HDOD) protein
LGEHQVYQAILRLKALPAFFPAIEKALVLLDNPSSHSDHIQRVICSDPAIAARILRLANSAYFGFYSEVRTVSLAITLIGREKISTLLRRYLAEELIQMLSGRRPAAAQIREISVVTATVAHCIAARLVCPDKEEILVAGLLHNVGELVLLSQFRDSYERMLEMATQLPRPQAEDLVFGVRSSTVGRWLLEAWNFPEVFPAVIVNQSDPWSAHFTAAPAPAIITVHIARKLAEVWVENAAGRHSIGNSTAVAAAESISSRALAALEINREFLIDIYEKLPDEIRRAKGLLN